MILVSVEFDHDIVLPGRNPMRVFPPIKTGWSGDLVGWSIRVVGDRVEIVASSIGDAISPAARHEMEVNGITAPVALVSVPLHRCILRYVGSQADELETQAPSRALLKQQAAPPPPAPPKPKPVPPPEATTPHPAPGKAATPHHHQPQPAKRPPGARVYGKPPVSKEIEVDGNAPTKRSVIPLEVE